MHFLTCVFIPAAGDVRQATAHSLRPFCGNLPVPPWKKYLDDEEVRAMARHYRLRRTSLRKLAERMEDWNGSKGGVDEGGLFAVHTFNPHAKWDWYGIGWGWDGIIRGNVQSTESLVKSAKLDKILPHDFLTPDGRWHKKSTYLPEGYLGGHIDHKPAAKWRREFLRALQRWPGHRVVAVDQHW